MPCGRGKPPATARRQLHNAVAAIRRSFASAKYIVVKDGPGYRMHVDPQDIDAHRFTTMIARAAAAAAAEAHHSHGHGLKSGRRGAVPPPFPRPEEDIMHPMFKELFIDTDADDLAAEDDRRRRMHRSRRARPAIIVRPAARQRENRPRP